MSLWTVSWGPGEEPVSVFQSVSLRWERTSTSPASGPCLTQRWWVRLRPAPDHSKTLRHRPRAALTSLASLCARNTPSTCFSDKAGKTKGFGLKGPCSAFRSTISSPAKSGLQTRSSTTGRSPSPTTWPRPTSCCVWRTTARCCTPCGECRRRALPCRSWLVWGFVVFVCVCVCVSMWDGCFLPSDLPILMSM